MVEIDPYAAPEATISIESENDGNAEFFALSTAKLVVMCLVTFQLYQIYWFYKNWVLIKSRDEPQIMPVWRAIFSNFWYYSCFIYIEMSADDAGIESNHNKGLLAILFLILGIAGSLPEPYFMVTFLSLFMMIPINSLAARVNQKLNSNHQLNDKFSLWNWLGIVVGGAIALLAVLGVLAGIYDVPLDG